MDLLIAIVAEAFSFMFDLGVAAVDILCMDNRISRKALAGSILAMAIMILIAYLTVALMIR